MRFMSTTFLVSGKLVLWNFKVSFMEFEGNSGWFLTQPSTETWVEMVIIQHLDMLNMWLTSQKSGMIKRWPNNRSITHHRT